MKERNILTSDNPEVKDDNERLRLQGFLHCIAQDAIDDIDEDNFEDNVEMHFPSSLLKKAKSELFSSTPNLDESAIRYLIPLDNLISPARVISTNAIVLLDTHLETNKFYILAQRHVILETL